jgi:hypothetical protein
VTEAFRAEVRDWLTAHVPATPLPSLDTAEGFEAHRAWERSLAVGDLIATLAAPPHVPFAAGAEAAGLVLCAEDGVVSQGIVETTFRSIDSTRSLAEVHRGPVVAQGVAGAVARALDFGTLACAAQLLGAGRARVLREL